MHQVQEINIAGEIKEGSREGYPNFPNAVISSSGAVRYCSFIFTWGSD